MECKIYCPTPIEQEVEGVPETGYAPYFFPAEGAYLPFRFTDASFTRVLSALVNGAQLTYGAEGAQVVWDFLVNVEYPVDLCAQIAECIATSEATQAALRTFITTDDEIADYMTDIAQREALSLASRGQNLLKPDVCDPDFIFNQTSVMVQLLHDTTEDFFEAIEVGTNTLERGSIITSGIPIFGQVIPADELLQFADQLIEEVMEDYTGAYDEALYDSIRCDLFCLVRDDCTLSIDRAIEYYEGKISETFPDDPWDALKAIIGFLNVGDFGTDTPVYAMHLLMLALIRQSSDVFGIDFGILGLRVTAAGGTPNNDWETLCEDCPSEGWTKCWNTETDTLPFTIVQGVYTSGVGYEDTYVQFGNGYRGIVLSRALGSDVEVTEVSGTFVYEPGTLDATGDKTAYIAFESVPYVDVTTPTAPTSPFDGDVVVTGNELFLQFMAGIKAGTGDPGGSVTLKTLCISGNGVEPIW